MRSPTAAALWPGICDRRWGAIPRTGLPDLTGRHPFRPVLFADGRSEPTEAVFPGSRRPSKDWSIANISLHALCSATGHRLSLQAPLRSRDLTLRHRRNPELDAHALEATVTVPQHLSNCSLIRSIMAETPSFEPGLPVPAIPVRLQWRSIIRTDSDRILENVEAGQLVRTFQLEKPNE
jgi:hypothetical protein